MTAALPLRPLLQARQIQTRIQSLARDIDRHYQGESIVFLVVLKGGMPFGADLMRELKTPMELEFARSRSYLDGTSPQQAPRLELPDPSRLQDRHVLVVDDILDSGSTYLALREALLESEALSVRGCFLLDKPSRRVAPVKPDFVGFEIPDVFVVGYGLDHQESWRQLPWIGQLESP